MKPRDDSSDHSDPSTRQIRRESDAHPSLRLVVLEGPDKGATTTASDQTLTVGTAKRNTLELKDPTVSRFHCELTPVPGGARIVDLRSTNGTFVGPVRVHDAIIAPGTVVRVGQSTIELSNDSPSRVSLYAGESLAGLVGRSTAMRAIMEQLQRVSASTASVLVTGESGTGKELVAEALHRLSPRSAAPFVVVDCAALVPTLVASELFGHEKGAFTGADRQHIGAFERARGGTLFLDEIGELPAQLQPALLGALERRRVRRLGGRADTEVDVRVVCATNRDLRASVNDGSFRLDLYYRVAVVTLALPPLRERAEDVPALVEHFLRVMGYTAPLSELFSPEVLASMSAHRWPGNVRELRNVIEATVAFGDARRALETNEPAREEPVWSAPASDAALPKYKDARASVLQRFERAYIEALIQRAGGNVSQAARLAGLDRGYVSDLLARHQVGRGA
ncbi:MAG: sigma 54-dependent Fis family transcriptional regulator [Myxococcales bacterium]|nr:sigma 54-dependent Fis family transcriptional regulator [Myxococcales bacterium]